MPADVQVNSFQSLRGPKMGSENTVFSWLFCTRNSQLSLPLRQIPRWFEDTNVKKKNSGKMLQKRLVLVLVSEHYLAVFLDKVIWN